MSYGGQQHYGAAPGGPLGYGGAPPLQQGYGRAQGHGGYAPPPAHGAPPAHGGYGAPPPAHGAPAHGAPPAHGGYGAPPPAGGPGGYGGGFAPPPASGPPPGADPQLWSWFSSVGTDRSGAITSPELERALINGDWTPFDLDTILDTDRSGTIGFNEVGGVFFLSSCFGGACAVSVLWRRALWACTRARGITIAIALSIVTASVALAIAILRGGRFGARCGCLARTVRAFGTDGALIRPALAATAHGVASPEFVPEYCLFASPWRMRNKPRAPASFVSLS
ncbi:hypothetical protein C8J57DRAFT_1643044 [Mycena rebaudengoi]|nr:hypothetical protein C8J57DRAFT_1643044 [Mycena rebaudengoi]